MRPVQRPHPSRVIINPPRVIAPEPIYQTETLEDVTTTSLMIDPINLQEANILRYADTLTQVEFGQLLDYLASHYTHGQELISDARYDELVALYESKFTAYNVIGAEPSGDKITLPYFLASLDKIKRVDIDKWITTNPGPWVLEDKLDGATLYIELRPNKPPLISTRGRGVTGENASHVAKYLNLPTVTEAWDIRGEVILSKADFQKYGAGYVSPRALVPGLLKTHTPDLRIISCLKFIPFAILNHPEMNKLEQCQKLYQLGFQLPRPMLIETFTWDSLEDYYNSTNDIVEFVRDGLVLYQANVPIVYPSDRNPKQVMAFKPTADRYFTTIQQIIWQPNKDRTLVPVAYFDTIFKGDCKLNRVSLDNARFVQNAKLGVGARILIEQHGPIPRVVETISEAVIAAFPDPAIYGTTVWDANGVHLLTDCDLPEVCVAKMAYFLKILDIKDFGDSKLMACVRAGITTVSQLIMVYPQTLMTIPGIGPKSANGLYSNIREKLNGVRLEVIMTASGFFSHLATTILGDIVSAIPDILDVKEGLYQRLLGVPGVSDKRAKMVIDALEEFKVWMAAIPQIVLAGKNPTLQTIGVTSTAVAAVDLHGMTFVFSGKRRSDVEEFVRSAGGAVSNTITKKTTALILADMTEQLGKAQKARGYGIPVISYEQMSQTYGIPI